LFDPVENKPPNGSDEDSLVVLVSEVVANPEDLLPNAKGVEDNEAPVPSADPLPKKLFDPVTGVGVWLNDVLAEETLDDEE